MANRSTCWMAPATACFPSITPTAILGWNERTVWARRSKSCRSGTAPANRQTSFRDWQASYAAGGSPGAPSTQPIGVVINELLAATQPPVERTDSIELYNTTDGEIPIGGWYLSDSSNFFKYQIPAGTTIPAGQYVVFDESHFNPTPQNPAANHFGLNGDEGDDLYLVIGDPASGVTTFVDEAHFRASANGESWARIPNGTGRLTPAESLTFGAANSAARRRSGRDHAKYSTAPGRRPPRPWRPIRLSTTDGPGICRNP